MKRIISLAFLLLLTIGIEILYTDYESSYKNNSPKSYEIDYDDDDDRRSYGGSSKVRGSLRVTNKLYQQECSECHFAYQPGLLPTRSWVKLMNNLENHFDTDASLEPQDNKDITKYLTDNAGDKKYYSKHFGKIIRSIYKGETPLRITNTRYFERKHDDIPKRLVKQKKVKSFANCAKCHETASRGDYSDDNIYIPNYGVWDD